MGIFVTDILRGKRGVKLLQALSGAARLAVEEMSFEELACDDGVRNIMAKLKDFFQPQLEVSLPRAFEAAVYGPSRSSKEGFNEYLARMEKCFNRLEKEGVALPDGAQGYILYRQAALSESQDQRLLVWSDGKYDKSSVIKALRKLDKVVKDSRQKSSFLGEGSGELESYAVDLDQDEEDGNFIYVAEGDLDEVMDEKDVMEALASYQEVRKALRDQRTSRGYFDRGNKGKGFKGGGKGKLQKVHLEQLKLRTRCHRCKAIGHWARECKGEEKPWPSSGTQPSASSAAPSRSGFLVTSSVRSTEQDGETSFWLRAFIQEQKAKTQLALKDVEQYKERSGDPFIGIVTKSHEGVVDTAAEGGLIGSIALRRLEEVLSYQFGLCCKRLSNQHSSAKRVGGQAKVLEVVLIPMGIDGFNGLLEATVIEGEVPLLLPVKMMKALQVKIDFRDMTFKAPSCGIDLPMNELPSGHVTIGVTSFENGIFTLPPGNHGCSLGDFRASSIQRSEAMGLAQSFLSDSSAEYRSSTQDGGSAQPMQESGAGEADASQEGPSGRAKAATQEGAAELEGTHGQDRDASHVLSNAKRRGGVVSLRSSCMHCCRSRRRSRKPSRRPMR